MEKRHTVTFKGYTQGNELLEGRELLSFQRLRKDVYADLGKFKAGRRMMLWVAVLQGPDWGRVVAFNEKVASLRRDLVKGSGLEGRRFSWAGEAGRNFLRNWGLKGCFQQGVCEGTAQPGTPGTGDIVWALYWTPNRPAIVTGAPSSPWPEHRLYFSHFTSLRKDIKAQGDVLFALFGVWFSTVVSRAKIRHLLTYSVQLRLSCIWALGKL